jgi:NAD-dependent dihydropyrimidine dehydrogenase PreA subunit
MANTPLLNECNQCGALTDRTDDRCPENEAHRTHQLSIRDSFERIRRTRDCYLCGAPVARCRCYGER